MYQRKNKSYNNKQFRKTSSNEVNTEPFQQTSKSSNDIDIPDANNIKPITPNLPYDMKMVRSIARVKLLHKC
jgi:hypothetical protein